MPTPLHIYGEIKLAKSKITKKNNVVPIEKAKKSVLKKRPSTKNKKSEKGMSEKLLLLAENTKLMEDYTEIMNELVKTPGINCINSIGNFPEFALFFIGKTKSLDVKKVKNFSIFQPYESVEKENYCVLLGVLVMFKDGEIGEENRKNIKKLQDSHVKFFTANSPQELRSIVSEIRDF